MRLVGNAARRGAISNRALAQLAMVAVCVGGPLLVKDYLVRMPASVALFGMVLGLVPVIIPTRPARSRPDLQATLKEAEERGLSPQEVERLREIIEHRIRRPAMRFRIAAGVLLYLAVCLLFGIMLLIARAAGIGYPLLSWWTGGFLWGLLGSIVWTVMGGEWSAPQAREQ